MHLRRTRGSYSYRDYGNSAILALRRLHARCTTVDVTTSPRRRFLSFSSSSVSLRAVQSTVILYPGAIDDISRYLPRISERPRRRASPSPLRCIQKQRSARCIISASPGTSWRRQCGGFIHRSVYFRFVLSPPSPSLPLFVHGSLSPGLTCCCTDASSPIYSLRRNAQYYFRHSIPSSSLSSSIAALKGSRRKRGKNSEREGHDVVMYDNGLKIVGEVSPGLARGRGILLRAE